MNQVSLDDIFNNKTNSNFDIKKFENIYEENSQYNLNNNSETRGNENLMNNHFNYNLVYNNIENGKKEIDPFSFVNELLKPKKN